MQRLERKAGFRGECYAGNVGTCLVGLVYFSPLDFFRTGLHTGVLGRRIFERITWTELRSQDLSLTAFWEECRRVIAQAYIVVQYGRTSLPNIAPEAYR